MAEERAGMLSLDRFDNFFGTDIIRETGKIEW
jgi:hypothetical protein